MDAECYHKTYGFIKKNLHKKAKKIVDPSKCLKLFAIIVYAKDELFLTKNFISLIFIWVIL
jgi:hypothetical protein